MCFITSFDYSFLNERLFLFFFKREIWRGNIIYFKRKRSLNLFWFEVFSFLFPMSKRKGKKKAAKEKTTTNNKQTLEEKNLNYLKMWKFSFENCLYIQFGKYGVISLDSL